MNKFKLMNALTQENNRLIAKFEGFETYEMNGYINVHYSDDNVRTIVDTYYHSSWDWLMPVVEKCFDKQEEVSDDLSFKLNDALLETNIESLYRVVVEFIKQYNNQ